MSNVILAEKSCRVLEDCDANFKWETLRKSQRGSNQLPFRQFCVAPSVEIVFKHRRPRYWWHDDFRAVDQFDRGCLRRAGSGAFESIDHEAALLALRSNRRQAGARRRPEFPLLGGLGISESWNNNPAGRPRQRDPQRDRDSRCCRRRYRRAHGSPRRALAPLGS